MQIESFCALCALWSLTLTPPVHRSQASADAHNPIGPGRATSGPMLCSTRRGCGNQPAAAKSATGVIAIARKPPVRAVIRHSYFSLQWARMIFSPLAGKPLPCQSSPWVMQRERAQGLGANASRPGPGPVTHSRSWELTSERPILCDRSTGLQLPMPVRLAQPCYPL